MIGGRRPLRGRKPADRRVRIERPHAPFFRYTGPGTLVAKPAANVALTPTGRFFSRARARRLRPPSLDRGGDRRAPVEDQGAGHLQLRRDQLVRLRDRGDPARPAARGRQRAVPVARGGDRDHDPAGGRLHLVSPGLPRLPERRRRVHRRQDEPRAALRPHRRRRAAHRLRHDRGGVDGRGHRPDPVRLPGRVRRRIQIAFVSISLITIANLRGLRESGNIFAVPTYAFVFLALGIIAIGLVNIIGGTVVPPPPAGRRSRSRSRLEPVSILLLLKAFAGGSVALTGVEAIANGVPAFKPPESKNAANTMTAMSILLGILFIGLTLFAVQYGLRPTNPGGPVDRRARRRGRLRRGSPSCSSPSRRAPRSSCSSRRTPASTPSRGWPRSWPRTATCRASSRSAATGSRTRGASSCWRPSRSACCAAFGGDTHALIPLYSVGVFVCFTLSQIGMVKHWFSERESGLALAGGRQRLGRGPDRRRPVRGRVEKFVDGAYLVVILVPLLVGMMLFINHQYARSKRGAARRARSRRPRAPPRGAGRRADPGPQSGGRPGDQRRPVDR